MSKIVYYIKLSFVLLLICAIAGGILSFINGKTKPIITKAKIEAEKQARKKVLPKAVSFVADSIEVESKIVNNPLKIAPASTKSMFYFYHGKDESGKTVGYTFKAAKSGYSSVLKTMVGIEKNTNGELEVINISIVDQAETPGLGAKCVEQSFADKFKNKTKHQLVVDKDGGSIVSITGATITTRAIANSIKDGVNMLQNALKGGR